MSRRGLSATGFPVVNIYGRTIGVVTEPPGEIDHFRVFLSIGFPAAASPAAILRSWAALSLAIVVALSNCAMAPRTCRTRTAVGVSSVKKSGAVVSIELRERGKDSVVMESW